MRRGEADGAARRLPLVFAVGAIGTAVSAAGLVAYSVLLDWTGYTSGGQDGGHMHMMSGDDVADAPDDSPPDDAGMILADAPPLSSCGTAQLCSPPVPTNAPGWSGPYALSLGAQGSLPACDPTAYQSQPAFEGNYGLKASSPQCGCSCSRPQGLTCDPPKVTFFSDSMCDAACGAGPVNGCLVIPSCGSSGPANFLEISGATPSASAYCTPDASVVMPPASWNGAARVCQPSTAATKGSCTDPGELCLPASTPYCLMFAGDPGDAGCPGDWYVHRHVFYTGIDDQRGCTACTCGAPNGATCSFPNPNLPVGSFDTTCNVPLGQPFFAPSPCTAKVPSTFGLRMVLDASVEGGACEAGVVVPLSTGAAGTGATTLCCTQ